MHVHKAPTDRRFPRDGRGTRRHPAPRERPPSTVSGARCRRVWKSWWLRPVRRGSRRSTATPPRGSGSGSCQPDTGRHLRDRRHRSTPFPSAPRTAHGLKGGQPSATRCTASRPGLRPRESSSEGIARPTTVDGVGWRWRSAGTLPRPRVARTGRPGRRVCEVVSHVETESRLRFATSSIQNPPGAWDRPGPMPPPGMPQTGCLRAPASVLLSAQAGPRDADQTTAARPK
jgi:hypothetical protein